MFITLYLFYNKQFISFLLRNLVLPLVCCIYSQLYTLGGFSHVKLVSWENDSCTWFYYFCPKLNIKIKSIFWISLSFLPTWGTIQRQGCDFTPGVMLWTITHGWSSILINFSSVSPQQKMSHTRLEKPRFLNYDDKRGKAKTFAKLFTEFSTIFKGLCKM